MTPVGTSWPLVSLRLAAAAEAYCYASKKGTIVRTGSFLIPSITLLRGRATSVHTEGLADSQFPLGRSFPGPASASKN